MITMRNGTKYYRKNELSKLGYIKKEELKDKINEIDIWNKNGLKVKKEILELIDK